MHGERVCQSYLEKGCLRLIVGIIGNPEPWQSLLGQEGVPCELAQEPLTPDSYSAVVAGDEVHDHELTLLRNYLSRGGGLLCSAKVYAELRQTTYNQEFIRYLLSDPTSHFSNVGLIDVMSRCRIAWNANQIRTDRDSFAVHSGLWNNGHVVVLPVDTEKLLRDYRSSLKSFYSPGRRLPFERVATVSRNGLRKLVGRALEILHHHRGIPYVHLWYYPRDARSVFAFRIDTDFARPAEIDELYRLVTLHGIPTSWFVDVKNQQLYLPMFAAMEHQEIGVHCFEHRVFESREQILADLQQARNILAGAGMKPEGFAAPFGTWNVDVARAAQSCGFRYSSEFGYDYDNLPSYPLFDTGPSSVLQIPVHPVCIGSLKRQGYSGEDMKRYFDFVTEMKLTLREPLVFYHHPRDGNHDVLKHLFEVAQSSGVTMMYFGEYAQWWNRRLGKTPRVELIGPKMYVNSSRGPEGGWLRISRPDGTEAFTPAQNEIDMEELSWEIRPLPFVLPADYKRIRSFNYRIPLTTTIDTVAKLLRGQVITRTGRLRGMPE